MTATIQRTSDGVRILADGVIIDLDRRVCGQIAAASTATEPGEATAVPFLSDHHPMWQHYSGQERHRGRAWSMPEDLPGAREPRRHVAGMACGTFFEMLLSEPGRLFTSEEIVAAHSDVFASANAVAGCLNGFVKPTEELGRPFPFYWWEGADGAPSRYAVRPSDAAVFAAAGD